MDGITLPQNLFTINDLLALGGLVVAVYIIVSFLKEPLKMLARWLTKDDGDWIVRPATVLVALGILIWLMCVQGVVTAETTGLAIINAFLVALIAGAAHDYIVAPTKAKQITTVDLDPTIQVETPEDFAVKVATAMKTGDRGEEPPDPPSTG